MPQLGARSVDRGDDAFYRVDVFTQTGTEGYDLIGLPRQQVISDVLDRFEAHLSSLRYSSQNDLASARTPAMPAVPGEPDTPEVADDVERIES